MGGRKAVAAGLLKLHRVPLTASSPHLWILAAMFVIGIVFYYPQQILSIESPSLFSFLGLTRHSMERILFLVPATYASMVFGPRVGLVTLGLALAVILPRAFLLSVDQADALFQTGSVIITGVLINLWVNFKHKENLAFRRLAMRFEESEKQARASEQRYRYLFENASDAIWVQDVNGYLMESNRAFESLTGFKQAELKGVNLAKFLSQESLALAKEIRLKLVNGENYEQPYEQQFFVKDGVSKTVMMSTNAIITGGRITGFEHVARDVTRERQQQQNVRAYINQITRAQEEERKRVARDLHDDISPSILILIQKLDILVSGRRPKTAELKNSLQQIRSQAVEALEALRTTAQGLRPRIIDDLGLVAAVEWIAEELERDQQIQVTVEAEGIESELSPETQIVLFRIAQEALNNIRKHARASRVAIRITREDDDIVMTVTDDGIGFEVPERVEDMVSAGKLGLMGMYERARLLEGSFQVKSRPGETTRITVRLPAHIRGE
jgi:two-component system sensor histidine kinase DegS